MKVSFRDEVLREAERIISLYPRKESALLPILHIAQREFGYISDEVEMYVAELLQIPPIHVREVVSFYTMFRKKPAGRYHIQVCRNISCSLLGSEVLIDYLKRQLKIEEGETTDDGLFTLSTVECLGACGSAPVIQINDVYYENMTKEKLERLIDELRRGGTR
uniref:NADH dehydrogenase I subunit E n=1 Tax=uncultured prokaryote TaxID=198431 RepID=H5SP85_9ZZZZ|nr:NADH dehydrogenase I subunit E [uncultured prokaryote]